MAAGIVHAFADAHPAFGPVDAGLTEVRVMVGVSVVVPAYNSARELRECLPALVRSIPPPLEIIVVDDASTDDTSTVAAEHGAVVLRLARNSGPGVARNTGSCAARGDVVFFVNADVVVMAEAIGRVIRTFEDDPGLPARGLVRAMGDQSVRSAALRDVLQDVYGEGLGHPRFDSTLRAEWAAQRIKDLSLRTAILNMFVKARRAIRTLIEEFDYPRLGLGMMWNAVKDEVERRGGHVRLRAEVVRINHLERRVESLVVANGNGEATLVASDFNSSMPITELIQKLSPRCPPTSWPRRPG
jgi:glycosyltransferase involved in cell wall biosynthesis